MSGPFSALGTSASGISVMKTWVDALADNIANVNTAKRTSESAFQARYVVAQSVGGQGGAIGQGVRVARVELGNSDGTLIYDPNHPLADKDGLVRMPDENMVDQMTHLIVAQRAYQANVTVFERARDTYLRALEIGKP